MATSTAVYTHLCNAVPPPLVWGSPRLFIFPLPNFISLSTGPKQHENPSTKDLQNQRGEDEFNEYG